MATCKRNVNKVYIDGVALKRCLEDRGITLTEVGNKLGRSDGFISKACSRGVLHPNIVDLIKLYFDIDFEEYAKKEEPEHESDIVEDVEVKEVTETVAPAQTVTIDYNMLYQTIYTAVYHAIAKWELNEDQRKDVKEAV